MAEGSKIARRYAQALLELCDEANNHALIGKQLDTFVRAFDGSDDLRAVLRNPVIDVDTKKKVVEAVCKKAMFAPSAKNFLNVLLDHERIGEVLEITAAFKAMIAARTQVVTAAIKSATPLRKTEQDQIQAALSRITGKKVELTTEVDPTLIGGVVAQVGHVLLDGSVATDLEMLREQLLSV